MEIANTVSESGDECHRDIMNVEDKYALKYAPARIKPPTVYMCCDGVEIQLTQVQYEDLLNNLCQPINN